MQTRKEGCKCKKRIFMEIGSKDRRHEWVPKLYECCLQHKTNLSERNYTKGFASEESAARTSFHRKTCQHRWYLLFLLPSPNLANLDAGQKSFNGFMSFYVRVFFCRKPVLFPSIESRVPVNALFNGRTFCTKGRSI